MTRQKRNKCVLVNFALMQCYSATVGLSVESQIVGYETSNITDGNYNFCGVQFQNVTGGDIDLNADGISIVGLTGGADSDYSDKIMFWNTTNSSYDRYYFYYDSVDEPEAKGWYDQDWGQSCVLNAGVAFWYKAYVTPGQSAKVGKQITISGAVESDIVDPIAIVDGQYNMIVNPYPVSVDISNPAQVAIVGLTGGADSDYSDKIMFWNPTNSSYDHYFFYYDSVDEPEAKGWYDQDWGQPCVIPAGIGFWYKAYVAPGETPKKDKSIQFVKPF